MKSIRFSVIIPAYNAAATIEAAIQSCLSQSLLPLEIIVVDDASTDDTAAVVRSINSERLHLIILDKNSGPSVARNHGMDAARGDYYAFLDADDVWSANKLFEIDTILRERPEIEFVAHPFKLQDTPTKNDGHGILLRKISTATLLIRNTITPSCVILKNTIGLRFNESMRYTEDYELWLRISGQTIIYWTERPLTIKKRLSLAPGGQSERKWEMRKGEMKACLNFVLQNPLWSPAFPFLLCWSLLKHLKKTVSA